MNCVQPSRLILRYSSLVSRTNECDRWSQTESRRYDLHRVAVKVSAHASNDRPEIKKSHLRIAVRLFARFLTVCVVRVRFGVWHSHFVAVGRQVSDDTWGCDRL